MKLALTGDSRSYHELLTHVREWLVAYFSKRVPQAILEDLVQNTLLSIHEKRHTFDPQYKVGPWVAAVARHRWIDYLRAHSRKIECELSDNIPASDVVQKFLALEDVAGLLRLVPREQAEMIQLVKLNQLSVEEASQKTGRSPANVKVLVHRGIRKLIEKVGAANERFEKIN